MNNHVRTSLLILLALGAASAGAQMGDPLLPSHCKAGEHVLLTARLGIMRSDAAGTKWIPNGKVVSLCTDRPRTQPFERLAYRYGPIGAVEMEEVATPAARFSSFVAGGHKVGNQGIFFEKGPHRYYVMEAMGMGSGVSLVVYRNGKKVVDLFSGGSVRGKNYLSNTGDMDFEKPGTPTLSPRKAPDAKDFS